MAALSMATIAALVNGPGLGQPVVAGAAEPRRRRPRRSPAWRSWSWRSCWTAPPPRPASAAERATAAGRCGRVCEDRRAGHADAVGAPSAHVVVAASDLSRTYLQLAPVPVAAQHRHRDLGRRVELGHRHRGRTTSTPSPRAQERGQLRLPQPAAALLADSPWWLMPRCCWPSPTCSAAGSRPWSPWSAGGHPRHRAVERRMVTLTMTLVATVLVMIMAIVLGVWMGRSRRADTVVRPFLDAFQTLPPFVYLVPALALFGQPVHRDRGRGGLRRADGDQAGRRRHPRACRRPPSRRRGPPGSTQLADDQQGAAADVARGARAGDQPGPALRAVDGRHRRPGRRRQPRLPRGRPGFSQASCSARGWRRASRSPPSG